MVEFPISKASSRPVGVLLVNLGTPDSPRVRDVRRLLREFLSDPSVVDVPRWLWWPLLHLVILPFRAPRSAHAYAQVWMPEGSPLLVYSRRQSELVARELGPGFHVELAMRYGHPSLSTAIENLCRIGCERIVLVPLFPQYSHATTGSIRAAVAEILARRPAPPNGIEIAPWFEDEGYIAALAERVQAARAGRGVTHHVFSFHGLPQRFVDAGDPYRAECEATANALAAKLALDPADWTLVFQSRFGREAWLQPYADQVVPALAQEHKRLLIAMPGFTADCLETIEEIGLRLAADFKNAGGEDLVVVPALNESPLLARALARLIQGSGGGT